MEKEKEKLVLDGNAFYEIDLECIRKRESVKKQEHVRNTSEVPADGNKAEKQQPFT